MATYSYAGLGVRVSADTRGLARDVRTAATTEGTRAGREIGQRITAGLRAAGRGIASGLAATFGRAWDGVTRTASRAFDGVAKIAGKAAGAASSAWSRAMSTGVGRAITGSIGRAFDAVSSIAGRAAGAVSAVWGRAISPAGSAVTSALGRAFSAVTTAGGRAASAVGSGFARAATSAGSAITSALGRAWDAVGQQARQAQSAMGGGGILAAVKGLPTPILAAAAGTAALAAGVIRTGVAYNTLSQTSRAAFTTILGSSKAADQMMARIAEFARSSPFPRQAFIEGARQMVSFGISAQKVIPYFTAIQDAVAASGGSAQTLSEITLVMSQIQAAGKITGVDLMQFAQRGINAAELIGVAMGKTSGQIRDQITAGSLDATKALDALVAGMEKKYSGAADNVRTTWAGTTDRIKGAMRDFGAAIVAPFIDPKGGGYAVEWGNKLATSLRGAIPATTAVMNGLVQAVIMLGRVIAPVVGMMARFSGWWTPLAGGILAAVAAFKIYTLTITIGTKVMGLATTAINAMKFALFALQYAWATNPIGLVVLALIALVAAFVIAYKRSETFRNIVNGALSAVAAVARAALGWLIGLLGTLARAWASTWGAISSISRGAGTAAFGPVRAAGQGFTAWWAGNGDAVKMIWGGVVQAFSLGAGTIRSVLGILAGYFRVWALLTSGIWRVNWAIIQAVASIAWLTVQTMIRIGWAVITGLFTFQFAIVRAVWSVGWAVIQAVLRVAWAAIVLIVKVAWAILAGVITIGLNLLTGRWGAAWTALKNMTAAIWNAILAFLRVVWGAMVAVGRASWSALGSIVTAGWNAIRNTTVTIGTAVQNWMSGLWVRIQNGARAAWQAIVNTIANVWGGVQAAVRGPIVYVVGLVNRLINGINSLTSKIGIPRIPTIAGFREGGRVGPEGVWGGGDRQIIAAEAGEWVLTKRQARGIGYANLRRLPHYQTGGYVGHPDDHIPPDMRMPSLRDLGAGFARITHMDDLWRAGKELVDDFTGMLTWAASEAFRKLAEPMKKAIEPWATDPSIFPKQWLGKTVVQIIDKAIEFIAGKSMDACGSMGMGGASAGGIVGRALQFNGRPYRWGGGANPNTGFDCSSFVSYIAGTSGLPLPGGFRVPSMAHGPVTTDYLSWGGMTTVPLSAAAPGAVAVSPSHIGFIVGPNGSGFAARSTATGIGPQNFARGYTYRRWNGSSGSPNGGAGGVTGVCDVLSGPGQGGPANVLAAITQAAGMLGMPWAINAFMAQAKTESNFNARAINNWDSNARAGTPSKGILQVIEPTFRAFCGPFCNRGIWDILANAYAAMNYAKSRYGARLLSVIGHGHGYAGGGVVSEPVVGFGLRSGGAYSFAERGPELVSPLSGPPARGLGAGARGVQINVYPSAGMDERALAAAVSRELTWAAAGGAP